MTCYQTISFFLLFIFISGIHSSTKHRFDNFKVYSVKIETIEQLKVVQNLEKQEYDFWHEPILGDVADVMISPDREPHFEFLMNKHNIKKTVKVANVQT